MRVDAPRYCRVLTTQSLGKRRAVAIAVAVAATVLGGCDDRGGDGAAAESSFDTQRTAMVERLRAHTKGRRS